MYQKILFFSFILFSSLFANDVWLEAKGAYFRPTDSKFRKIYSGGGIYSLEGTFQIRKGIHAWASGGCFYKKGHTIGQHSPTTIILFPLGVGLKSFFSFDKRGDGIYLGGGLLPTYVYIHDKSPFLIPKSIKWALGGILKSGILVPLYRALFLDFFFDYQFLEVRFSNTNGGAVTRTKGDLSGMSAGVGLGAKF